MRLFAGWLYFLGGVSAVFGAALYFAHIPNVPSEDQLEWYEGFLRGIRLEKDLDGTDIVYFIFRDHDKRYRYFSRYPQYVEVRDRLGIYRTVELLVEKDGSPGLDGAYDVEPGNGELERSGQWSQKPCVCGSAVKVSGGQASQRS